MGTMGNVEKEAEEDLLQNWQEVKGEIAECGDACTEALSAATDAVNKELAGLMRILQMIPEFAAVEFHPSRGYFKFMADAVSRPEKLLFEEPEEVMLYELLRGYSRDGVEYYVQILPVMGDVTLHVYKYDPQTDKSWKLVIGEEVYWRPAVSCEQPEEK